MSLKGQAYIVGAYEHPTRHAVDKSLGQLHAEVAAGALAFAVMIVLSRNALVVEMKRQFCRNEKMKTLLRAG